MDYRPLGATGIEVSAIGFGCNDLGRDTGDLRHVAIASAIDRALESGITLFDTANSYGFGTSERVLGQILGGRRHKVVICSKAGHAFWGMLPVQRWAGPVRRHSRWNFRPRFLEMAVAGSLRRLHTDYLDVFYLHNPPPAVVGDDAVFETLDRFRQQGHIRCYGISCPKLATSADARSAMARTGVGVVQVPTSVRETVDLTVIGPEARARAVGLVGRQPFAHRAVLTDPQFRRLVTMHGARSAAQTALRFALELDGLASVLVGMRTVDHVTENVSALNAPALSASEREALWTLTRVR